MKLKSTARNSVATVPSDYSGQERRFAQSVSESLDTLTGRRGQAIDRAVTFRDLLDTGILALAGGVLSQNGSQEIVNPNNPADGPTQLPTKPTNLTASGAFNAISLSWGLPPYNGHDYVEIYRYGSNNFSAAKDSGAFTRYYGDTYTWFDVGLGSQETWYYWIRAVNVDGVAGPFYSSTGVSATTALDYLYISGLIDDILDDDLNALGLNTTIGAIENDITTTNTTVSGLTSTVTTLNSTVGSNSTSIQTNTSTINGVQAKYSVKIDNNGHVAGFGLISTSNTGTPTSSFIVAADRFAVASNRNSNYTTNNAVGTNYPFKVITSTTTINGASVPAGVYIDDAFIHDAQITNAVIANGTITDGKIVGLTAGKITSGNIIISSDNNIAIRQGKNQWNSTTSGFWLGNKNGYGAFSIGSGTSYVRFDGGTSGSLETSGLVVKSAYTGGEIISVGGAVNGAYISALTVGTLSIANNAATVPESIQYNASSSYFQNNVEKLVSSSTMSVNFGTNTPSKVILNALLQLGSSGLGANWAAAILKLKYTTGTASATGGTTVATCQVNSRKGAPPTLVITKAIGGWSGTRKFYLTCKVTGESGSASNWWKVSSANINLLGSKK